MKLYVPNTTGVMHYNGRRVALIRGRSPIIEEGNPILSRLDGLVKPLEIDYPAPAKRRPKEVS